MTAAEFHAALQAAGVSRPWLARAAGVSRSTVDAWCAGRIAVPADVAKWLRRRLADPPAGEAATAP